MGKYPISREFWPFSSFKPPLNRPTLALARAFMGEPRHPGRKLGVTTEVRQVKSADGTAVRVLMLTPPEVRRPAPCLLYAHGGGFVLKAAPYHYELAARYAAACGCVVAFVQYRLAPGDPFPAAFEDCYGVYEWLLDRAEELGIDPENMGVAGDSAGAALAAGTALILRDRGRPLPRFQMLPYPFLDLSSESASARRFTDTPMWNSKLSKMALEMAGADRSRPGYIYWSPAESPDLRGLPPAYIETAEFDCLHDDGVTYARRLREAGVPAELRETRGTMHGFDIVGSSPTAKAAVERRIGFMRRVFWPEKNG